MKEPNEIEIIERAGKMIDEVDFLEREMREKGQDDRLAFVTYALRKIARLEIIVSALSNALLKD